MSPGKGMVMAENLEPFEAPADEDFRAVSMIAAAKVTTQGMDFLVGWFAANSPNSVPYALAAMREADKVFEHGSRYFTVSDETR
jgi:hypothetical protein